VLTGGFMVAEAIGGVLTGSLALLADAGHMLTDCVALVLAYVAYRMSERRGTARLTYGFDRLKILVAYTNGLIVLGIAVWIVIEAIDRFANPAPVLGGPMLAIAALGLLVNVAAFILLMGGDRTSLNLRGALIHVAGDLLGSIAAIVAAIIILATGWTPADPILSVLVAMLLLRSAWGILRESAHILLEGVPPEIQRDDVAADLVRGTPGVSDVHHMHIWSLDGRQQVATLHARLREGTNPQETVAALKARLRAVHRIEHATIEVEDTDTCADDAARNHRRAARA
jgi:cobalt-zinc-cadmium efflux system protein